MRRQVTIHLNNKNSTDAVIDELESQLTGAKIESVEEVDVIGMSKGDIILSIVISFSSSIAANAATPYLQDLLNKVMSKNISLSSFDVTESPEDQDSEP